MSRPRTLRRLTALLTVAAAIATIAGLTVVARDGGGGDNTVAPVTRVRVQPITWTPGDAPSDAATRRVRAALLSADRYLLKTWFPKEFGDQPNRLLDFGGVETEHIRGPAEAALALAISLRSGAYDARRVALSRPRAEEIAVRLVASLAERHIATRQFGWGDDFQTAYWAAAAGLAGWLLWDKLDNPSRTTVQSMVVHEADRFLDYRVPYYRSRAGKVVYKGDSKSEENAWNASVLQLATAMFPRHRHARRWMEKNVELMISAFARPSDVHSARRLHGRALRSWLQGSNIEESGLVVNHDRIHPDYQSSLNVNLNAAVPYTLAGMRTPRAAIFNGGLVYEAMTEHVFTTPPFDPPGGTIYVPDSAAIYYPEGADWGTKRRIEFAGLDARAGLFRLDLESTVKAARWESLHMRAQLELQRRFKDGRTFGEWEEFRFAGREQLVAAEAAQTYLLRRMAATDAIKFTERSFVASGQAS